MNNKPKQIAPASCGIQHGSHKPGALWWLLAVLATLVGSYGVSLQDGRPKTDSVPGLPWLDEVHFLAGGIALIVGVWAFRRDILTRRRQLHRRMGQLYVACALASGMAGLSMAAFSMGGLAGHLGFGMLGVLWLGSTTIGWWLIHKRKVVFLHRRWMVRSYALCCAAISLRVETGILVPLTGSFGIAYAIVSFACWVPNVLFAEWWLARTTFAGRFCRA